MQLHTFYRRFTKLTAEERNTLLTDVRHDPLTPMILFKQLEYAKQMQYFYTQRVEELLRIAEESFPKIENNG